MNAPTSPSPDEIRHLSLADVLVLNRAVMLRLRRPAAPLRDERLLESAIMRPQMAAYYEGADLIRQATLLAIGISQAQAFVDGNKRTAYLCMDTFLRLNDLAYSGHPLDLAKQLESLARRKDDREAAADELESWLRERVGPRGT